jgi:NADH-quinone oxidoreductase subunit M
MTIILGAVYMLVLYKKTFFGPITNPINEKLKDLSGREYVALIPLVLLVVYLGLFPKTILKPVDTSVKQLVQVMYLKSTLPQTKAKIASVNTIGEVK